MDKIYVRVSVDACKAIEKLQPLIEKIEELKDLTPDYVSHEADEITDGIYKDLSEIISVDK